MAVPGAGLGSGEHKAAQCLDSGPGGKLALFVKIKAIMAGY